MRYCTIIISLMILFSSPQTILADNTSLLDSLKYNVIKIKASFSNDKSQSGFGFVVAADEQYEYYVTANHVVRNDSGPALETRVIFYDPDRSSQYAILLEKSDSFMDLAVLKVVKPKGEFGQWRRDALGTFDAGSNVWSLGEGSKWTTPKQPGQVTATPADCASQYDSGTTLSIQNMKTRKGTSGAPLISESGIVGMMLCSGEKQVALKIDNIRKKLLSSRWNFPWQLTPRKTSPDLSGKWNYWDYWDKENAQVELERLDEAHYRFKAVVFLKMTKVIGKIVVDGNTVYSDLEDGVAKGVVLECSKGYGLLITGKVYDNDPDEDPYEMRLTRTDKKYLYSTKECLQNLSREDKTTINKNIAKRAIIPLGAKNSQLSAQATTSLNEPLEVNDLTELTLQGCWKWSTGAYIVIDENHTARNGMIGATWAATDKNRGEYNIAWPSIVDTLSLSNDGSVLSGSNSLGFPISAVRKSGDTSSLVGNWLWVNGITVAIQADTIVQSGPFHGQWFKSATKWIIEWPIVDAVSLAGDGRSLRVINQFGSATGKRDENCAGSNK